MGVFLIAPLLLDDLFGYSVGMIALVLLARPLVYSVSSPIGGRLAMTVGERPMVITGSALMVLSMIAWVFGAHWISVPMILVGLVLSGLAMGLASPSYATLLAGAVDEGDLGIANAMGTTMMNIGMLAGIQTMFVVLGDGRSPDDFATVFALRGRRSVRSHRWADGHVVAASGGPGPGRRGRLTRGQRSEWNRLERGRVRPRARGCGIRPRRRRSDPDTPSPMAADG